MSHNETARRDVAELFGEGEGAPKPRVFAILILLGAGLVVAVLGMACTAVPGGIMVLFAWMLAEKEMDRVHSGYLPAEARGLVRLLQAATFVGVLVVVLLFLAQGLLFCSGFYDQLWMSMLDGLVGGDGVPIPSSPPDPNVIPLPPGAPVPHGPPPAPAP